MFFSRPRLETFDNVEVEKYRRMTLDPDFKGAVLDYRMMVLNWNKQHSQEEGSELTICEELLYPVHGVFFGEEKLLWIRKDERNY